MEYLLLFWTILISFLVTYFYSRFAHKRRLLLFFDREGALFFFVILTPLVLLAIVTKDPISFGNFEIPQEPQWLGSLFASFFGAWQFYLRPLKNKIFGMDREIGEVKSKIDSIEADVKLMKDALIGAKARRRTISAQ